jgi:hypothetical protein
MLRKGDLRARARVHVREKEEGRARASLCASERERACIVKKSGTSEEGERGGET